MRKELDRKLVKSMSILGVGLIVLGLSLSEPQVVNMENQYWRTLAVYSKFAQIGITKNLSVGNTDTMLFFNLLGGKFNLSFSS